MSLTKSEFHWSPCPERLLNDWEKHSGKKEVFRSRTCPRSRHDMDSQSSGMPLLLDRDPSPIQMAMESVKLLGGWQLSATECANGRQSIPQASRKRSVSTNAPGTVSWNESVAKNSLTRHHERQEEIDVSIAIHRKRDRSTARQRGNISNIGLQCLIKRVPAENTGFPSRRKNPLLLQERKRSRFL